jgi:hypothetical protein
VHDDFETTCSRCLFRPTVRAPSTAGDNNRSRRKLGNAGFDRFAVGTASASYDRNSHVTVPVINTKAEAEAPSRRKVVRDSSTCHPEVARSSTRIIDGCGSAMR